jgi:hypothetical protein
MLHLTQFVPILILGMVFAAQSQIKLSSASLPKEERAQSKP